MYLLLLFLAVIMVSSNPLYAQNKFLSVDDLYDPEKKIDFSGDSPKRLIWLKDGSHYLRSASPEDGSPLVRLMKVDARSGESEGLYDGQALKEAFLGLAGFNEEEATQAARKAKLTLSADENRLLLDYEGDLYWYELGSRQLTRLTHTPQEEEVADWSASGELVSFVREHDLYVIDLNAGDELRLTYGGNKDLRNGILDWVYQEEIFGRYNFKAHWWSHDSNRVAFLQLDDSEVPEFSVVDHLPVHLDVEVLHYPKAGDPNPTVKMGIANIQDGDIRWADLSEYERQDFLVVNVDWSPSGDVIFQVQDREQTWLDLLVTDPESGEVQKLFRETSNSFVNVLSSPHWLSDGSFLWESERDGYRHLYHYTSDGKLLKQLTRGEWEVTELEGIDEKTGKIFFSGTKDSPLESHLYWISSRGGAPERVTTRRGTHSVNMNRDGSLYFDSWSDLSTPTKVFLYESAGELVRTIEENEVAILEEYDLGKVEFHQVETRDGFLMEAMMIKPPDFNPALKYPVLSYAYSGPHAPQVKNRWRGTRYLWHQMLAQRGFIIWICDNRTASGKGIKPTWLAHRNLGELELQDLEDGLDWLKEHDFIDPERIGLWGWSYGGYMTSYALTHSKSFKMGIAGAPVTDWRLYDSIYTERYMGMPQTNREGYRKSSALEAAANLHGKLLLIHGTIDENVHLQNTLKFAYELQKAGKSFEMMLYPKNRHAVSDPKQRKHLYELMTRFIMDNL